MKLILTIALSTLMPSAPAFAASVPAGAGDPGAVSCVETGSHIRDLNCKSNAPAFAGTAPEGVKLRAYPPVGNGDPNAISCWAYRTTPPVRGLQCARNSVWARLNGRFNGSENSYGPSGSVPTGAINNR